MPTGGIQTCLRGRDERLIRARIVGQLLGCIRIIRAEGDVAEPFQLVYGRSRCEECEGQADGAHCERSKRGDKKTPSGRRQNRAPLEPGPTSVITAGGCRAVL